MLCRYCNNRLNGTLISSDQTLNSEDSVNLDGEIDLEAGSTCSACLGLLQPGLVSKIAARVKTHFDAAHFDAASFTLNVSCSQALLIRDRILQLQAEHDKNVPENEFQSLKDLFRHAFRRRLQTLLHLEADVSSDFNICINLQHNLDEIDASNMISSLQESTDETRARRKICGKQRPCPTSRTNLISKLKELDYAKMLQFFGDSHLASAVDSQCSFEVVFERQPLYIGGRYCKYSRYVHQTPWTVDGEKRSKDSVLEVLQNAAAGLIVCDGVKFTASGREDADVRMLGSGRPFALQFSNPRNKLGVDLADFERRVNSSSSDVQVNSMALVSALEFDVLNKTEESKIKHYVALCCFKCQPVAEDWVSDVSKHFPLEICQKTPIRVLHRRPLLNRKRKVFTLNAFAVDSRHFQIRLSTEAGTYVKEFVHGDFGRTRPSLSDILGAQTDILELDVEKVDVDWPLIQKSPSNV